MEDFGLSSDILGNNWSLVHKHFLFFLRKLFKQLHVKSVTYSVCFLMLVAAGSGRRKTIAQDSTYAQSL